MTVPVPVPVACRHAGESWLGHVGLPSQSNGNELWLTVPVDSRRGLSVSYARCHCSRYPGRFLSIERLLPPSTGGIRKASPIELG